MRRVLRGFDTLLRLYFGVREFTAEPDCILRIALCRADRKVELTDGTAVRPGDLVVDLHWWNERLPKVPPNGPNLAWARVMRRRIGTSLAELIAYSATEPALREAVAFRARIALRRSATEASIIRSARRFGFELPATEVIQRPSRWPVLCDNIFLWVLIWTFNPGSLRCRRLMRERYALWASRHQVARSLGAFAQARACSPKWPAAGRPACRPALEAPTLRRASSRLPGGLDAGPQSAAVHRGRLRLSDDRRAESGNRS